MLLPTVSAQAAQAADVASLLQGIPELISTNAAVTAEQLTPLFGPQFNGTFFAPNNAVRHGRVGSTRHGSEGSSVDEGE